MSEREHRITVLLNHLRREGQRASLAELEARLRNGEHLPSEVDAALQRFAEERHAASQHELQRGLLIAAAVAGVILAFIDLPAFLLIGMLSSQWLPTNPLWLSLTLAVAIVAAELLVGYLIARHAGRPQRAWRVALAFATPVLLALAVFIAMASWFWHAQPNP